MDDSLIESLARVMGLEKALAGHRDDVLAAAKRAADARCKLPPDPEPAAEPWPPMQVRPRP